MSEQILPCPFCGSSAHAGVSIKDHVFCDGCKASMEINIWNTRYQEELPSHPKVSVKEIMEIMDRFIDIRENLENYSKRNLAQAIVNFLEGKK